MPITNLQKLAITDAYHLIALAGQEIFSLARQYKFEADLCSTNSAVDKFKSKLDHAESLLKALMEDVQ